MCFYFGAEQRPELIAPAGKPDLAKIKRIRSAPEKEAITRPIETKIDAILPAD